MLFPLGRKEVGCPYAAASDHDSHYSRLFDGPFEAHSDDALKALAKEMEGNGGEMTRKELRLESFTSAILLPTTLPASDAAQNEEPLPSQAERRIRRKHQHHRRPHNRAPAGNTRAIQG